MNLHHFHIPVMGLAYTIDTPIKVAHYGISSVVSIVQDNLIEKMRKHYYEHIGETYHPIKNGSSDYRARRITDYLNLMKHIVDQNTDKLRESYFVEGSDITKYFEMLPESIPLKKTYKLMKGMQNPEEKAKLQNWLRNHITPGSIDVNIMTKLDNPSMDQEGNEIENGSDAVAALRGYANSQLEDSTIVLSAGMNPRLFAYMEGQTAFDANTEGKFQKKIAIKVSDYRSALIQGKMLAKKGLWVSEFRIESGLNCGGHAFATDGYLLGVILDEFKTKREELTQSLFDIYNQALTSRGNPGFDQPHQLKITVQGGIGTHEENQLLMKQYNVDALGWGTPFLLVPEATTVDEPTLKSLVAAREKDVFLSNNSPLGVRFHYLKGTSGELEKLKRIANGKPGSPCTEKYLVSNTEFGDKPICTASHNYQKKKLKELNEAGLDPAEYERQKKLVLDKECLCIGLSNAAINQYQLTPFKNRTATNICPGPNIAYFSEIVSLRSMVDHIYGRHNVLKDQSRPHMFIKELSLYIDYLKELVTEEHQSLDDRQLKYVRKFHENLQNGITYYRGLMAKVRHEFSEMSASVTRKLDEAELLLSDIMEVTLAPVV
ncbi:hypothetical protein [Marinoscillum sp. MHG1-6]|uniref:hypothetical protein n=1 Tax=Marinoscillum sp. MHG1-6 TaxID=2959627 RepID=UPI0021572648|nr:hypothetical protein [Marinoscillum sp. MHG1-6]